MRLVKTQKTGKARFFGLTITPASHEALEAILLKFFRHLAKIFGHMDAKPCAIMVLSGMVGHKKSLKNSKNL